MDARAERERQFHNEESASLRSRAVGRFYAVTRPADDYYESLLFSDIDGKKVLEYGCGTGSYALALAERGAVVSGIDISEVAIEEAKRRAAAEGVNVDLAVMNAQELVFDDASFDLVCGSGILHHLDLEKAFTEISRVLKVGGKAVFIEPLGHNPLLCLYRKFTPNLRTRDEHPLLMRDIHLAERYFSSVEIRCFCFLTLAGVPFRRFGWFPKLRSLLSRMDAVLFQATPFMRRAAWVCTITLTKLQKQDWLSGRLRQ